MRIEVSRLSPTTFSERQKIQIAVNERIRQLNDAIKALDKLKTQTEEHAGWRRFLAGYNGFFEGMYDLAAFFVTGGAIAVIVKNILGTAGAVAALYFLAGTPLGWGIFAGVALFALVFGIVAAKDAADRAIKQRNEDIEEYILEMQVIEAEKKRLEKLREELAFTDILTPEGVETSADVTTSKTLPIHLSWRRRLQESSYRKKLNELLLDSDLWKVLSEEEQLEALASFQQALSDLEQNQNTSEIWKNIETGLDIADDGSRHSRNFFWLPFAAMQAGIVLIESVFSPWMLGILAGGWLLQAIPAFIQRKLFKEKREALEKEKQKIKDDLAEEKEFNFRFKDKFILNLRLEIDSPIIISSLELTKSKSPEEANEIPKDYKDKLLEMKRAAEKREKMGIRMAVTNGAVLGALHPVAWFAIAAVVIMVLGIATGGSLFVTLAIVAGCLALVVGGIYGYRAFCKEKDAIEKEQELIANCEDEAKKCDKEIRNIRSKVIDTKKTSEMRNEISELRTKIKDNEDRFNVAKLKLLLRYLDDLVKEYETQQDNITQKERNFCEIFDRLNPVNKEVDEKSDPNKVSRLQRFLRDFRDFWNWERPFDAGSKASARDEEGNIGESADWTWGALAITGGLAIINVIIGSVKRARVDRPRQKSNRECEVDTQKMQQELRDLRSERFTADLEKQKIERQFKAKVKEFNLELSPSVTASPLVHLRRKSFSVTAESNYTSLNKPTPKQSHALL